MNLIKGENITIERLKNIILSIGFMLLLVYPSVHRYISIIPEVESTENRQLAEKPIIKYDHLDPFPGLYENFYTDNFSLRNQLVRLKSLLITGALKKSPMPDKVIFGKNNWLYLVKDELDTYRGNHLLNQSDIDKIANEMVNRKRNLDQKNIGLYFVIVPTKYTVYPEYLPNYVDKISQFTSTDLVIEALIKKGIDVLDLRDTLINAKNGNFLYYQTDNHWNELGSLLASKTIIDKIKKDYPEIPAINLSNFSVNKETRIGGNAARLINMEKQFQDTNYILAQNPPSKSKKVDSFGYPIPHNFPYHWEYELIYEVANDSLPDLLLIRDSFGGAIIPYVSQSFHRSVYIFDNWNYTSNEHIIENEEPDVVVYLVLECLWHGFLDGIDKPTIQIENK